MARDHRYNNAKNLILSGYVKTFTDILGSVPKSVIYKDLGMHRLTFDKMLKNPLKFSYEDTFRLAALFDLPFETMNGLIMADCLKRKRKK